MTIYSELKAKKRPKGKWGCLFAPSYYCNSRKIKILYIIGLENNKRVKMREAGKKVGTKYR